MSVKEEIQGKVKEMKKTYVEMLDLSNSVSKDEDLNRDFYSKLKSLIKTMKGELNSLDDYIFKVF